MAEEQQQQLKPLFTEHGNGVAETEVGHGVVETSDLKVKTVDISVLRSLENCWRQWICICRRLNAFFNKIFDRLAGLVASYPYKVVLVSTLVSLALMTGFLRFYREEEVDKLYIPQSSLAIKDLNRGHKHFGLKLKAEEFVLKYEDDRMALTEDIFRIALDIHRNVTAIPGLEDICYVSATSTGAKQCLYSSPLEILNFDVELLSNISKKLQLAFLNKTRILAGGRPSSSSFPDFFGNLKMSETSGLIYRADALRSSYFVRFPEDNEMLSKSKDWEYKYISYMNTMKSALKRNGIVLLYNAGRSMNDSVSESSGADITLVTVAFGLMILFCMVTLARYKNMAIGHFVLGLFGILVLALGIGSAFGLAMLTGLPFLSFVGVLPFLILGVGIDNMFIIVNSLDRLQPNLKGKDRIKHALGHVGSSITMTTLTDLVAFGVSTVTDFPAIKYFCTYAALGITACYLLMVTMFMGYLTLDVRRIETGRKDCFLVCQRRRKASENPWKHHDSGITNKIMYSYATFLMKSSVKYPIFLFSCGLLALGIWGGVNVDQSFDMLSLGKDDSAFVEYFRYRNTAFPVGIPISVILDEPVDYTNPAVQKEYAGLCKVATDTGYTKGNCVNWMREYLQWGHALNISVSGSNFYPNLRLFLEKFAHFLVDIKFNATGRIEASRMVVLTKDNDHSIFRKDGMLSLRHDFKTKSTLNVYAAHMMFIYFEQFVVILGDTVRNLAISAGAILLITLPYLVHPLITFMVFFSFISLIFELLGMMYIWNVSLNSISMIIIVMSIGFAVDYSAHVAHAFMISKKRCADQRVIEALMTMGSSVLMGGASTFLGTLVTAFASSEIFRIFFKMMSGIVFLGLLHGLVFLPVLLAIFCRTELRISPTDDQSSDIPPEDENVEEASDSRRSNQGVVA